VIVVRARWRVPIDVLIAKKLLCTHGKPNAPPSPDPVQPTSRSSSRGASTMSTPRLRNSAMTGR
jgi:hypothetical protein